MGFILSYWPKGNTLSLISLNHLEKSWETSDSAKKQLGIIIIEWALMTCFYRVNHSVGLGKRTLSTVCKQSDAPSINFS